MPEAIGKSIAEPSPAAQRAYHKAAEQIEYEATVVKTAEEARRAIHVRQAHNIHVPVSDEIHRSEEDSDIKALRATLAEELNAAEQKRIEDIAQKRFQGG
jgi:hypothetical protein